MESKYRVEPVCTLFVCKEVVSVFEKCLPVVAWDFECYVRGKDFLVKELRALIHKVSCHRSVFR
jgi:hypothetical protein